MAGAIARIRVAMWVVAVGAVASAVVLLVAVRTSLQAEKNLQAAHCVIRVMENYVDTHDGHWPDSWNALISVKAFEQGGFAWPDDLGQIRSRVTVDFAVRNDDVVSGTTPVISTIKVASPCYEMSDEDFKGLLAALRRHSTNRGNAPTEQNGGGCNPAVELR